MNVVSQGWRRLVVGVVALGVTAAVALVAPAGAEARTVASGAATAKVGSAAPSGTRQQPSIWEW